MQLVPVSGQVNCTQWRKLNAYDKRNKNTKLDEIKKNERKEVKMKEGRKNEKITNFVSDHFFRFFLSLTKNLEEKF